MGEPTTPTIGGRIRGAAVVLVLAIGVPAAAVLPWGGRPLLSAAVLVAAFSLVHSMHAGWRRSLVLVPLLLAGTLGGALTAGTSAWPWFVGALGGLVGLATRVGWLASAVITGFITVGVPATDGEIPWSRLVVVALVGLSPWPWRVRSSSPRPSPGYGCPGYRYCQPPSCAPVPPASPRPSPRPRGTRSARGRPRRSSSSSCPPRSSACRGGPPTGSSAPSSGRAPPSASAPCWMSLRSSSRPRRCSSAASSHRRPGRRRPGPPAPAPCCPTAPAGTRRRRPASSLSSVPRSSPWSAPRSSPPSATGSRRRRPTSPPTCPGSSARCRRPRRDRELGLTGGADPASLRDMRSFE